MESPVISSAVMRKANKAVVLSAIRAYGPISRTKLAEITKLSYPTIRSLTKTLIDEELVEESSIGPSIGGRKPVLLSFRAESGVVAGIDFSGPGTTIGLADLSGNISHTRLYDVKFIEPAAMLEHAVRELDNLQNASGIARNKLAGVGVSCRGYITANGREVHMPGFSVPVPLKDTLERTLGVPVFMDHNYNIALSAERDYGAANNLDNFIYVWVGVGISAAAFLNGEIYRGPSGNAGEFGHMIVEDDGPRCEECGARGCIESVAGLSGLAALARWSLKEAGSGWLDSLGVEDADELTAQTVLEAAARGDRFALSLVQKAVHRLWLGIRNLVTILGPEAVFIGGSLIRQHPFYWDIMDKTLDRDAWPFSFTNTKIIKANYTHDTGIRGAVSLALRSIFLYPRVVEKPLAYGGS